MTTYRRKYVKKCIFFFFYALSHNTRNIWQLLAFKNVSVILYPLNVPKFSIKRSLFGFRTELEAEIQLI